MKGGNKTAGKKEINNNERKQKKERKERKRNLGKPEENSY